MLDFTGNISNQFSLVSNAVGFGLSLKTVNELPFNFYLTTNDNIMRFMNELDAITMGHASKHSAVGKNLLDNRTSTETTIHALNNNRWVEQTNKILITEETVERKDFHRRCLSIKHPLYVNNKIIGIVGCSIYFDRDSLTQSLFQIVNIGLLNTGSANHLFLCPDLNPSLLKIFVILSLKIIFVIMDE